MLDFSKYKRPEPPDNFRADETIAQNYCNEVELIEEHFWRDVIKDTKVHIIGDRVHRAIGIATNWGDGKFPLMYEAFVDLIPLMEAD